VKKRAGFTLVELLVVIGIIALLIGILMPALTKARAAAIRTVCLARMRELGNAAMLYAANNRGSLPPIWNYCDVPPVHFGRPAIYSTTGTPETDCYLTKYLGKGDTAKRYICPALQADAGYSLTSGQSYRYNQILGGYRSKSEMTQTAPGSGYYYANPWRIGQIRQSSRMALFLDTDLVVGGFGNGGNAIWFRQDSSTVSSTPGASYHWPNQQGTLQPHGKFQPLKSYVGYLGLTYPGIGGLTNVAFVDGSVRLVPFRIDASPVKFQGSDCMFVDPNHPTPMW